MDLFSIAKSRGFSCAQKPIFQVTSVYIDAGVYYMESRGNKGLLHCEGVSVGFSCERFAGFFWEVAFLRAAFEEAKW
jgi:hypothetical protein